MYLTGQLEGVFEDQSVLRYLERMAIISTFHFSVFICPLCNLCPTCIGTKDSRKRRRWIHFAFKLKKTKQFWCWRINNQSTYTPFIWVLPLALSTKAFLLPPVHHPHHSHTHTVSHFLPLTAYTTFCDLFFLPFPAFVLCYEVGRKPGWSKDEHKIQITHPLWNLVEVRPSNHEIELPIF